MIHVVIELLKTVTAVTDLVPSTSIMPVKGEQTVERPHIIVDLLSTDLDRTKEGMVFETYNIEVFIAHTSIFQAWRIHEACRTRLDNYTNDNASVLTLGPYDIKIIRLADISTDAHELDDFYIIRTIYALEMDKWTGNA
jgi:hypothetical protein|tara:strand:+ start:8112 stop:8528 length:417 start_codon:yes stop_codon:yes gene_type:complete